MATMTSATVTSDAGSPASTDRMAPGRLRTGLRQSAHAVLALPLGLLSLAAVLVGQARLADRWQQALARRFLDVRRLPAPPRRPLALVRHTLLGLPVHLLAFVLVVPAWALFLARGVFYPVFGADNLEASWGGPTLAGAWLVHFIQGPPLLLLITAALQPVARLQARLAER